MAAMSAALRLRDSDPAAVLASIAGAYEQVLAYDGCDAGDALDDEETRQLLARVIHTLPEREQIVVTLYYYEGLTLAESASHE